MSNTIKINGLSFLVRKSLCNALQHLRALLVYLGLTPFVIVYLFPVRLAVVSTQGWPRSNDWFMIFRRANMFREEYVDSTTERHQVENGLWMIRHSRITNLRLYLETLQELTFWRCASLINRPTYYSVAVHYGIYQD